jgi:hypothetical protein
MTVARIIAIWLLAIIPAVPKSVARPIDSVERKLLLTGWKSVRIGVILDMGDVTTRGQTIHLQRLDPTQATRSTQATLSISGQRPISRLRLPVLVAIVSDAYATKLIEQALEFYAAGQREREAMENVQNPSLPIQMFLEFLTTPGPK